MTGFCPQKSAVNVCLITSLLCKRISNPFKWLLIDHLTKMYVNITFKC